MTLLPIVLLIGLVTKFSYFNIDTIFVFVLSDS